MQAYDPTAANPCAECIHHGTGGQPAYDPAACIGCTDGSEYVPGRMCGNCRHESTDPDLDPCADCHAFDGWRPVLRAVPGDPLDTLRRELAARYMQARDGRHEAPTLERTTR